MHPVTPLINQAYRLLDIDPSVAAELAERIRPIAEGYGQYHLLLAEFARRSQQLPALVHHLRRAAEDPDTSAQARLLAARTLSKLSVTEGAGYCRDAIQATPDYAPAYNDLGRRLMDTDPVAAGRQFLRAIQINPTQPEPYQNLGVLAERRENWDEAAKYSAEAVRHDPTFSEARLTLGIAFLNQKKKSSGCMQLLAAAILDPGNAKILAGIAIRKQYMGNLKEAEPWFHRALAVDPNMDDTFYNFGSYHFHDGNEEEAAAWFKRIKNPRMRALGYFKQAIPFIERNDDSGALELLSSAISIYPSSVESITAAAEIRFRQKEYQQSLRLMERLIILDPSERRNWQNLALVRDQLLPKTAVSCHKRAIQIDPDNAEAWSALAVALLRLEQFKKATACARRALSRDPALSHAYFVIGQIEAIANRLDTAHILFRRSIFLAPDDDKLPVAAARAFMSIGKHRHALPFARRALILNPEQVLAYTAYGAAAGFDRSQPDRTLWVKRGLRLDPRNPICFFLLATVYEQIDAIKEALHHITQSIVLDPASAGPYTTLAGLLLKEGQEDRAITYFMRSSRIAPNDSNIYNTLGVALKECGRITEAVAFLNQAARHSSANPGTLNNLANAFHAMGETDRAVELYREAIKAAPDHLQANYNLGCSLYELGHTADAKTCFETVIRLDLKHASACFNLGHIAQRNSQFTEASSYYRRVLSILPNHIGALHNLGQIAQEEMADAGALGFYRRVVALKPDNAAAMHNLASCYQSLGNSSQALKWSDRTVALGAGWNSSSPAAELARLDDVVSAIAAEYNADFGHGALANSYVPASPVSQMASWNRGLLNLTIGRLSEGWAGYEYRLVIYRSGTMGERSLRQPLWDGSSDLRGRRLLVWREQGIGDEIMFANCLPDLSSTGADVIVEVSQKLLPLFRRSFPNYRVNLADSSLDPHRNDIDFHIPMGSLPRYFRQDIGQFPTTPGFLFPDPERVAYWRYRLSELGPPPYVGLSWRGRVRSFMRDQFYSSIEDWAPVFRNPPGTLINMQYDDAREEVAFAEEQFGAVIHTLSGIDMWNGLDEVAALLKAMDLLLSAGTAVFSLAGAVGTPCWLLWLENIENWPTLGTKRLPWYPSVRLWTRRSEETWENTVEKIATALPEWRADWSYAMMMPG